VLARFRADSPPCCLRKSGRGGCGKKRREKTPYFPFPSPSTSPVIPLSVLSPDQTIATFQRSVSQHCWAQHVSRVWPPSCNVLRHVGCLKMVKFELTTPSCHNTSQQGGQTCATCNILLPTILRYATLKCCDRLVGAQLLLFRGVFVSPQTSSEFESKGLFTRREGYPRGRVTLASGLP